MILIDFSQVMNANLYMAMKGKGGPASITIDNLRPMVLESLRAMRQKFKNSYGDLVIAVDSKNGSWRREVFPYYKCRRAKRKESDNIDWPVINEAFARLVEEIRENFPYPVVGVDRAEADDVIGVLCRNTSEKVLIVSTDKDFYQLPVDLDNVFIYNHIEKNEVKVRNIPRNFLEDKIIRGDSGDDVPNILTQDDTFAIGKRSKQLRETKIAELLSTDRSEWSDLEQRNYMRNQMLIDLSHTPKDIVESILNVYSEQQGKGRSRLYNYFVKNRLREQLNQASEF